jgi:hypothetical protein
VRRSVDEVASVWYALRTADRPGQQAQLGDQECQPACTVSERFFRADGLVVDRVIAHAGKCDYAKHPTKLKYHISKL